MIQREPDGVAGCHAVGVKIKSEQGQVVRPDGLVALLGGDNRGRFIRGCIRQVVSERFGQVAFVDDAGPREACLDLGERWAALPRRPSMIIDRMTNITVPWVFSASRKFWCCCCQSERTSGRWVALPIRVRMRSISWGLLKKISMALA